MDEEHSAGLLDCGAGRHAEDDELSKGEAESYDGCSGVGRAGDGEAFRKGEARPWARKPDWIKMSTARRPTERDIPRGEEALIRETLSRLSDMVDV